MIPLRAGAAAVPIAETSDNAPAREAPLRVGALVLDAAGQRLCIASTDSMIVPDDVLADATARIVAATGIPFDNLLICATHTHHAPCTIDLLGCHRDVAYTQALGEALVEAVLAANRAANQAPADAALFFAESQEASTGMNSRYLLKDGTVAWYAYPWEDVVRPTGPFDPDLPVLAVRRADGEMVGSMFGHAVHNIGALTRGAHSPGTYGLVAQEVERRHGGVSLFLPGAFGSTHYTGEFGSTPNQHLITTAERVFRLAAAVDKGMRDAAPVSLDPVRIVKCPFPYRVRHFDEEREEAAIRYWSEKYIPDHAEGNMQVFRQMRQEMAPVQGEERQVWLQVMRLGEVAVVGVPCEMFTALGLEIRRRSPFRHTYVVGLANGTIGYVGNRDAYDLGGYQLWAGWHSLSEPGTGEAMVGQVLAMLRQV